MLSFLLTIVAFIVALGLLVAVHEYGHYRVAVACGVKVLRFSLGFGPVLYRWTPKRPRPGQTTEFVISAFPLGGYVRMLDEREAPVDASERHRAFNTQRLRVRAAVVAAGPLANLLLALLLYSAINWIGMQEPVARLASPVAGSMAEQAGLRSGESVAQAGFDGVVEPISSFSDLRWRIARGVLDGRDLTLQIADEPGHEGRRVLLPLSQLATKDVNLQTLRKVGIMAPFVRAELGEIMPDGAAQRAGLHEGDRVLQIDGHAVADGGALREQIRAGVKGRQARTQTWHIVRSGVPMDVQVTPEVQEEGKAIVGRIGAYVGSPPDMVLVRRGPIEGFQRGIVRAWQEAELTVRMMGRMVIGQASLKNISGPLTIADYAGKSASLGWLRYLEFLAFVSLSLGVLNLMPLPVLDGGHLMYYLWEGITGKRVSDIWMERLQRGGVALLLAMMSIALFNDVQRLFFG